MPDAQKNDVVRYTGEPRPGLVPGELYRLVGTDHLGDHAEPAILWRLDEEYPPNEHAWVGEFELVEVAFCHCNFCDGAGRHPECPHNRPRVRPAA